jgi:hypothetical protein
MLRGLRYAVFRLEDGVSFVHVAVLDGHESPLSASVAFAESSRESWSGASMVRLPPTPV